MIRLSAPPASTQLTTTDAVQGELGIEFDLRLSSLIDQASAACVGFCGRPFAQATWIETFGTQLPLLLSRVPITAIAEVQRNGVTLADTEYALDPEAGILLDPAGRHVDGDWPHYASGCAGYGRRFVQTSITYTAGYLLPNDPGRTLPADVERAAIEMVKTLWFSSGAGARDPNIRSEVVDGVGSTQYRDPVPGSFGLPSAAKDWLFPYRRFT